MNKSINTNKKKNSNRGFKYGMTFDISLFILTIMVIMSLKDNIENLPYVGLLIIVYSILIPIKSKWNRNLLFLLMIISFINISLSSVDLINKGIEVANWQVPLRMKEYNMFTAKSILLFLSTINLFINNPTLIKDEDFYITRKKNTIISFVGILVLFIILLFGYGDHLGSSSGYVSNSNPLYEYSIVIYIIVWYFSANLRISNIILKIHTLLYIAQAIFYGDRSAAFMMIILFVLLNIKKINISKLLILSVVTVVFSNVVAIYRDYGYLSIADKIYQLIQRGLYSDTVSYAYYSSITLTALHEYAREGQSLSFFYDFMKSIFLGSSNVEVTSLTVYIRDNFSDLFNRGGGIYSAHFFAYFGYAGVFVSSIFLGIILKIIYISKSSIAKLYQILIVVFSLRWYLYNPITLFRSVLFIFTILLFASLKFHKLVSRKHTIS